MFFCQCLNKFIRLLSLKLNPKHLKSTLKYLELHYPRKRKSSITFTDVIKIIKNLRETDLKYIDFKKKRFKKDLENQSAIINKLWEVTKYG